MCRYLSLDQLKVASRLEEEFQVEIWGVVEGGHDMDRLNNSIALAAADALLRTHLNSVDEQLIAGLSERRTFHRLLDKCKETPRG